MGKRDRTSDPLHDRSYAVPTICLAASVTIGVLCAWLSTRIVTSEIRTPLAWAAPPLLRHIAWPVLSVLSGIALVLVLDKGWRAAGVRRAVCLYTLQSVFGLGWCLVIDRSAAASVVIVSTLWLLTAWTVAAFWSVRDVAAILLVPAWLWVTYLAAFTTAIWRTK